MFIFGQVGVSRSTQTAESATIILQTVTWNEGVSNLNGSVLQSQGILVSFLQNKLGSGGRVIKIKGNIHGGITKDIISMTHQ